MAVRFDASGEALSRTANLPPIATFSMLGWFHWTVDRGVLSNVFALGPSTGSDYFQLGVNSTGKLFLWNGVGGGSVEGSILTVGTWYHFALVVEGTGANQVKGYLNGVQDAQTAGNSGLTAGKLWLGNDNDNEWLSGRLAAVTVYDVALTAADILQEMHTIRPARFADLNGWYPVFPGSGERVRDYSGLARDWTEVGTLTDEDPPPVSWGAPALLLPFAAAAAAGSILKQVTQHYYGGPS